MRHLMTVLVVASACVASSWSTRAQAAEKSPFQLIPATQMNDGNGTTTVDATPVGYGYRGGYRGGYYGGYRGGYSSGYRGGYYRPYYGGYRSYGYSPYSNYYRGGYGYGRPGVGIGFGFY